jgi:hypothetical protein
MSVLFQITLGSMVLVFCTFLHIGVQLRISRVLRRSKLVQQHSTAWHTFLICAGVVLALLASHTVHLYIWALSLWLMGALPGHEQPIYFALVSYTTVGYGDVTLLPDFRIFGAMAAVNGILAFGLTTAFLVAFFPRVIKELRDG